ncbi:MAG: hypothetical protein K2X64_10020 [Rhodocyclaceae bacterium]|nr:hypothetical protein [Rhodocyclaceae bacterium]
MLATKPAASLRRFPECAVQTESVVRISATLSLNLDKLLKVYELQWPVELQMSQEWTMRAPSAQCLVTLSAL